MNNEAEKTATDSVNSMDWLSFADEIKKESDKHWDIATGGRAVSRDASMTASLTLESIANAVRNSIKPNDNHQLRERD